MAINTNSTAKTTEKEQTVGDKLDIVIGYLHALNRRDKLRTYGAMIRSALAIIPLLFFLFSAWYIYEHGDELLADIAKVAAEQAANAAKGGSTKIFEQFKDYMPK